MARANRANSLNGIRNPKSESESRADAEAECESESEFLSLL